MALSVQDRLDIAELVAKYNYRIDHFEAEAWADLFTEDGVFKSGDTVRAQGRAQLIAYLDVRRKVGKPVLRHWANNIIVEGDGATARLRAYIMSFNITEGLGSPYIMAEYDDQLVKIGDQWKFKLRHVTIVAGKSVTQS